ncbi:B2 protein [Spatholobus suberectus]|nr:B2 protein [Spatholobus suberectus]
MDQEDSKMGTGNPPEMSSNPLSSGKDETMGTENPLSSGKDDLMGTENPPEVSSNSLSSAKDGMMGAANPTEVSSNPLPSGKDDMMGTEHPPSSGKDDEISVENPPEVSSNSPSSVKDGMMGTANPTEVFPNPPSSGSDDMMGTENLPEVTSDRLSSGKDDRKKDTDSPEGSSKPELSDKDTPQSLKAKSKIVKKSQAGKLKAKKNNGSQQIHGRRTSKKVDNAESCHTADEKQISDNSELKETNELPKGKSEEAENKMKESQNRITSDKSPKEELDGSQLKDTDPPGGSSKPELSDKNTPQSLKAKSKIVKKSQAGKLKAKKNNGSQQIRGNRTSEKVDNAESCHAADEKQISDNSELKETNKPPKGKSEEAENKMKESQNRSTSDKSPKEESDGSQLKDTDPPEGSSKPELNDKSTPQSLRAKSKIVKKSQAGKLKAKKSNGSLQICGKRRIRNFKKVVDNAESCHNADDKQISDKSQLKETNDEPPEGKNQEAENKVKESQNRSTGDKSPREKSQQAQKSKASQLDKTEQKHRSKEKHRESSKGSRSRKNKDKRSDMEKSQLKGQKGEKLGGFIFMCNAKTKPDCFRYHVMGVSAGKKDDVLQIKPGLKLFLYDFDLKLLYGIYKASSSGGMKLEPRAFGGKFPAQVRFNIASDCFPLPESIFKKAIKDNYNEKHKFRTELTVRQVRKLTQLFRPVGIHLAVHPVHSQPKVIIQERESPDGVRGSWSHLQRESYNVRSLDRDHQFDQREEITHDLYRMENYQAHGLQRDRRNVSTASHSYERDFEPRHLDRSYLSNVPAHVESLRTDPLYLNDSRDPHHAYSRRVSPRDAYLAPLRREEISPNSYLVGGRHFVVTDDLPRRDAVQDRRYPIYSAADSLSDYNRVRPYHGDKLEASHAPVSSRYTFAGPSFCRR